MKYVFILLLLCTHFLLKAQENTKVVFQNSLSWQQVLDSAKKENKMVFVDLYTDWCIPCKRMESEIFSLKNIADTFNTKFINYRINAEQGEGITVAKRYGVGGYPYFVFVDGAGTLHYSMLGYRDEQQLLQDAKIAFAEANDLKPYGVWREEYDANKYDTAWLAAYISKRNKLRMDNSQLLEDYYALLMPADYMTSGNILLVTNSNGIKLNGKVYTIITKNFNRISPKEDTLHHLQEHILNTLESAINKVAVKAIDNKDEATVLRQVVPAHDMFPDKVRFMPWFSKTETNWKYLYYLHTNNLQKGMPVVTAYINKNYMSLSAEQIRKQDSSIYQQVLASYESKGLDTQQMKNMLPMIDHYFKTYATNDYLRKLTEASNLVYNNNATPSQLNTAFGWMKRATQIQESSANYELMAKLLYRLNRKPEAVNTMQTAIAKADNPNDKNRLTLLYNNMKENKKI